MSDHMPEGAKETVVETEPTQQPVARFDAEATSHRIIWRQNRSCRVSVGSMSLCICHA